MDQAVVQAIATLLAVVVCGSISAMTTAYLERQRRKHDETKRLEERLKPRLQRLWSNAA